MRAFVIFILLCMAAPVWAESIIGRVEKKDTKDYSQVVDASTGSGIANAKVALPAKKYRTTTDEEGRFKLGTKLTAPTIMSVQKDGYRPYSLTLNETSAEKPLVVGIEKTTPKDVILESDMIHLGDDSFCPDSANAGDFALRSSGAFYSKDFKIIELSNKEDAYIVIGSIIGIDTLMARELGQSKVVSAYASAPQVFINGNKIAEVKINGDAQEIKIPKPLVNISQYNEITIKAGKNMSQAAYIDYDDIEFTNLRIEIK